MSTSADIEYSEAEAYEENFNNKSLGNGSECYFS